MQPLSVSELNTQIKSLLEATFVNVCVEGEISNLTYHSSGHLYFSIKDANSSIRCVMFKSAAAKLKFRLEHGLKILLYGAITLYTPRGEYQIQCSMIEPSGVGSLALAFEQCKQKLQALGYFDPERKKVLPKFPHRVALITSATGAAIQDMQRVAAKRWPMVRLELYNVLVQGSQAAPMIARAIALADANGYDVIVVGRGGGSTEDLWAFNEECVAQAIFEASTPVVSAVGHEVDVVISDFVADKRAPTPSAAMEMILPDQQEWRLIIDDLFDQMRSVMGAIIHWRQERIFVVQEGLVRHSPYTRLQSYVQTITSLQEGFKRSALLWHDRHQRTLEMVQDHLRSSVMTVVSLKSQLLSVMEHQYENNDPSLGVKPATAIVVKEGKRVNLDQLAQGDHVVLEDLKMRLEAQILSIESLNDEKN